MKVTAQKENTGRYMYLKNTLQNGISKIASELNYVNDEEYKRCPSCNFTSKLLFLSLSLPKLSLSSAHMCSFKMLKEEFRTFLLEKLQDAITVVQDYSFV